MAKALPDTLYVTVEEQSSDGMLLAFESTDELEDGAIVGIYKLQSTVSVEVKTSLKPVGAK